MKILNTILGIGLFMNTAYSIPTWSSLNDFGGGVRFGAAVFVINGIGYVGTGDKGTTNANMVANDFWAINPASGTWTQIAPFGGGAKSNQVAFVINNEGYVGVGNNSRELWKYTPGSNAWTQMTPLPNNAPYTCLPGEPCITEYQGVAFAIGSKGYFRGGSLTAMLNKTSFWEYDPAVGVGGTWTQKKDLEAGMNGIVLRGSAGFAINGKGYVGAGLDENNNNNQNFYEYTPGAGLNGGSWAQVASLGGEARINSVSFATSTKGYVGLGYHATTSYKQIWEFDSPTVGSPLGTWTKLSLDFPGTGTGRSQAVGFAVGQNLFIGTGNFIFSDIGYSDFWQYSPSGAPVLPVELTRINATADLSHEHVAVFWETATEEQSAYFAIERQSKTNGLFEEIGRMKGAGNSAKTLIYNFIDEKPVYGVSYYRLRLADMDGKTTYSKAVSVAFKGAKVKIFPTYTEGYISIENGDKRIDDVYVWNGNGQLILQSKQNQLNLSELPRGLYLVQVKVGSETFVQKVTKR